MREELLHYVWKTKNFDLKHLTGTKGESIRIESFGTLNLDQGPDFSNARIWINDMLWAGNVEMHLIASDWYKHQHESDPSYDNVILHVVWEDDVEVKRKDGTPIPCLILNGRVSSHIISNYRYLSASETWIPCEKMLYKVSEITWKTWVENVAIERLMQRNEEFEKLLKDTNNDLEETFYRAYLRSFGLPANKEPFERLARACPLRLLEKHLGKPYEVESLLFGQSGLLPPRGNVSEYVKTLKNTYIFLQSKYKLEPLPVGIWKFSKMRPRAFPTLRIAQFAAQFQKTPRLLSLLMEGQSIKEIKSLFTNITLSDYWQNHYRFVDEARGKNGPLGESTIEVILINTVLPFMFFYGRIRSKPRLEDKALLLLQEVSPEINSITKQWKALGLEIENAMDTQALVHLKKHYCIHRKCLQCAVGATLMQQA